MKKISSLFASGLVVSSLFLLLTALMPPTQRSASTCFEVDTESVHLQPAKPNLRISTIATPGGLCVGTDSKVRVNITNGSVAAVKAKIPVILVVSQAGQGPTSYLGYLEKGIGPNTNTGQPVWFHNVKIEAQGTVTLKAHVNPDNEIEESNYNDNVKVQTARVTKNCGQATTPTAGNLTVTLYQQGSWSAGNYTAIANAQVTVKKGGATVGTGTTGSNGKVTINNVDKGSIEVYATKNGCQLITNVPNGTQAVHKHNMPTYNTNINVQMNCN